MASLRSRVTLLVGGWGGIDHKGVGSQGVNLDPLTFIFCYSSALAFTGALGAMPPPPTPCGGASAASGEGSWIRHQVRQFSFG